MGEEIWGYSRGGRGDPEVAPEPQSWLHPWEQYAGSLEVNKHRKPVQYVVCTAAQA